VLRIRVRASSLLFTCGSEGLLIENTRGFVPCFLLCSLSQDPGYLSDLIVKLAGRGTADTSAIAIWIWMGEESV
jgi:hypothetical protein